MLRTLTDSVARLRLIVDPPGQKTLRAVGRGLARPARRRDEQIPNPPERFPNPAEQNQSQTEQIPNRVERIPNSLSLFFKDLRQNRGLIRRPPRMTADERRRSGRR